MKVRTVDAALTLVMVATVAAFTAATAAVASSAGGDPEPDLHGEIVLAHGFGSTSYEMRALAPDPRDSETLTSIRSELEFPLDAPLLGARFAWRPSGHSRFSFTAQFLFNVGDPGTRMVDSDFVGGREVIHAESWADLERRVAAIEVRRQVSAGTRSSLSLLGRVQYDRIDQHIVGYEGWQRSLFSDLITPISGTAPVLDYRVTTVDVHVGAALDRRFSDHVAGSLVATIGGLHVSDRDDHILRGRVSEGRGWGVATTAGVEIGLLPGFAPWRPLIANLGGGLRYFHAEGTSDQTFADGSQYLDLATTFSSLQYQAAIRVGIAF